MNKTFLSGQLSNALNALETNPNATAVISDAGGKRVAVVLSPRTYARMLNAVASDVTAQVRS